MSSIKPIAIVHIDPQAKTVPMALVETLALLESHKIEFCLYDPSAENGRDWNSALLRTFSRIREREVFFSFSSENNYFAVGCLIFLTSHLHLLRDKEAHVCLPCLSLFRDKPFLAEDIVLHSQTLTDVVKKHLNLRQLNEKHYVRRMVSVLKRHSYTGRMLSGALNPDCRYNCTFCFSRLSAGGRGPHCKNRLARIMQLMDISMLTKAPFFKFTDPDFLAAHGEAGRFLKSYRSNHQRIAWRCSTRLDLMNSQIYDEMADQGCAQIFFGVEHSVKHIVTATRKGSDTNMLLGEFLKYWDGRIDAALSFMTGFKAETLKESCMNLKLMQRLRKIGGIKPYLGYYLLFLEDQRKRAHPNYLIALIYLLHMTSAGKVISSQDARALIRNNRKDPFFSFYWLTESGVSLQIIQKLIESFKLESDLKDCMPELERFIREMPEWAEAGNSATSLTQLNQRILSI